MLKDCRNQVALVVGGASGMGRLAAQRWAEAGGVAAVADIDQEGMRETASGSRSR
jgi:NAD(P)-dependent dehydrogenase (short-subunit alcohol dehydrogenase family)